MRRPATLLLVVALVASAGSFLIGRDSVPRPVLDESAPATRLPRLAEGFTLLACAGTTTLGLEGCAEHRILTLDRRIATAQRGVMRLLRTTGARERFVRAEGDWVTYRHSTCLSDADVVAGGSLAPVDYANCLVGLDQQHLARLVALRASYTSP